MNVHDNLKSSSVEDIKYYYERKSLAAAIGMTHVSGDFNLGNVIRSANFFGFGEVYYVGGKRHFDRRSCVGTHNYIPVKFAFNEDVFLDSINEQYTLVCVENNIPKYADKTVSIFEQNVFEGNPLGSRPPLFLFGEEQLGISEYLLDAAGYILTIPAFGTVRSMNVGSCASIVMAMYRKHIQDRV